MVVRMRHTRSHTRNRRSHHALGGERVTTDTKTGAVHPRHRALLDGTPYRGRTVMDKTKRAKVSAHTTPTNGMKKKTKTKKNPKTEK